MTEPAQPYELVIYTVGGTPEAVAESLKQLRPAKVIFVPSPETRESIQAQIIPALQEHGGALDPGRFEIRPVPDAQDFELCVQTMRGLESSVHSWIARGETYHVAVDFTGGTKCMSAALALVAQRWPCEFVYVGGSERTKDGLGVVVSGKERLVKSYNPWDSLGYQAIEAAALLFDRGNYVASVLVLENAIRKAASPTVKRELSTLQQFAKAYDAWDGFDHNAALNSLRLVEKNLNDLRHAFPQRAPDLEQIVRRHIEILDEIVSEKATNAVVWDLLANADRCRQRGRYDDGVARIYRAIEAAAQVRLEEFGFPKTAKILIETLPKQLQAEWENRASNGIVRLGLQDDYELLRTLSDPLGLKFFELKLNEQESPLTARNDSILAHGFQPLGERVFSVLWQRTLVLLGVVSDSLPQFPHLGGDPSRW